MKHEPVIYALRHNRTGKVYVGRSTDLQTRLRKHRHLLRKGSHTVPDLQRDYDTFGDDFTVTVLEVVRGCSVSGAEYTWMRRFNSTDRAFGYNYRDPSVNPGTLGKRKRRQGKEGGADGRHAVHGGRSG